MLTSLFKCLSLNREAKIPSLAAGASGQKGLPWAWRCSWTWSKEVGMTHPTSALSSVMGCSGGMLPHCYRARPRIRALQHGTTVRFSKPFSGGCASVLLGGTCSLAGASGTASSFAPSDSGPPTGCLSARSMPSVAIPTRVHPLAGTIVPVQQEAAGTTGGLGIRPLADPTAG